MFGENGYIFLAGDSNSVIDQHTGKRSISKAQLDQWKATVERRVGSFSADPVYFYMQIVPDKHSVYSEYLPVSVLKDNRTNATKVLSVVEPYLKHRVMFAKSPLLMAKNNGQVFHKIDTHWTDKGAYVGYLQLIDCIAKDCPNIPLLKEPTYTTKWFGGDLGSMLELKISSEAEIFDGHKGFVEIFNNRVPVTGKIQVYENQYSENDLTLLIFGGSSTVNFLKFVTYSFKKVIFCWSGVFDYKLIELYKPDVVVNQIRERFLIRPASDSLGINSSEAGFIKSFDSARKNALGIGQQKLSELFKQCLAKISAPENSAYVKDFKLLSSRLGLLPLFEYSLSLDVKRNDYQLVYRGIESRFNDITHEISCSEYFDEDFVLGELRALSLDRFDDFLVNDFLFYGDLFQYKSTLNFNGSSYFKLHKDVEIAGMHPLWHYVRHGKAEGRKISALF